MIVLIIIAIVVAIFFFTSKEDDKNLSVKYENKTQPPKQEEKEYDWWEENRTSPPYKVGDLYMPNYSESGMVVSTNDVGCRPYNGIGGYPGIVVIHIGRAGYSTQFVKEHLLNKTFFFDSQEKYLKLGLRCANIEELKIMGLHYKKFINHNREYIANVEKVWERNLKEFPEDIVPKDALIGNFLQGKYATKILSSTYTEDGKSVYLYDLKEQKSYTISLNDVNDESDFAMFTVRKYY